MKPGAGEGRFHDPRMRGFRSRTPVAEVHQLIGRRVTRLGTCTVGLTLAAGRVLAVDVVAGTSVPAFDRAAMDGFAVRGEETFGADPYNPASFRVIGRSRPGRPSEAVVGPGQAVAIATGAPLPGGADAVAKVESSRLEGETVWLDEPTPPGRHVSRAGEDIAAGEVVLKAGRLVRPQDVGLLSAIGMARVEVVRRPKVVVLVTGDELLPPGFPSEGARIADANSPMLRAVVRRDAGIPARIVGPLPDDRQLLRAKLLEAAGRADLVLVSGGSSTGPEDHAPGVVAELGELPVHGVALRPASPTGLGFVAGVPVVLLPGNPVSCLCAYDFFAGPILRRLGGRPEGWPYRARRLPLGSKISSALGRVDYARVRVVDGTVEPVAVSGASILSSTTRADGFVVVPADLEGYPAGAEVEVRLYDAGEG